MCIVIGEISVEINKNLDNEIMNFYYFNTFLILNSHKNLLGVVPALSGP